MVASTQSAPLQASPGPPGEPKPVTGSTHSWATWTASSTSRRSASVTTRSPRSESTFRAMSRALSRRCFGDWLLNRVPSCWRTMAAMGLPDGSAVSAASIWVTSGGSVASSPRTLLSMACRSGLPPEPPTISPKARNSSSRPGMPVPSPGCAPPEGPLPDPLNPMGTRPLGPASLGWSTAPDHPSSEGRSSGRSGSSGVEPGSPRSDMTAPAT